MSYRLIQAGSGECRPLVILYLVGAQVDDDVRAALGPTPAIAAFDDSRGEALYATVSRVRRDVEAQIGDVVLVGFSAGCQAVRRELIAGGDPAAVVTIDGTHATLPPESWQIEVWQKLARRARHGERLFVATCTQNTYVEQLPKTQRYAAVVTVLRAATGFALEPAAVPAGEHEGSLHVYSFASATTDHHAHVAQQRVVMPEMLRRYVAPWLAGRSALPVDDIAAVQAAVALSLDRIARTLSPDGTPDACVEAPAPEA
jgi:hypothetical protein